MLERRGAHRQIIRVLQLTERVDVECIIVTHVYVPPGGGGGLSEQHVWRYLASAELGRNKKGKPYFYSLNSCSFPSHTPTMLMGVFDCVQNIICMQRIAKISQVLVILLLTYTGFRRQFSRVSAPPHHLISATEALK